MSISVYSQQPHFIRLNNINLPVNESYGITQDHQGYIWIGTSVGLCRYNADSIRKYKSPSGLKDESAFKIIELNREKLLINGSSNYFYYYNKEKRNIEKCGFTNKLNKLISNKLLQVYHSVKVNDSIVYLNTQYSTFKVNFLRDEVTEVVPFDMSTNYNFMYEGDKLIQVKRFLSQIELTNIKDKRLITLSIKKGEKIKKFVLKLNTVTIPSWRVCSAVDNFGAALISFDNVIVKIDRSDNFSTVETKGEVLKLYVDSKNNLWAGTLRNGVCFYENSNLVRPVISINNNSVTDITEDYEKSIWCTTLEQGVFYCRTPEIFEYSNFKDLQSSVYALKVINNIVYCSSLKNRIISFKQNEICQFENDHFNEFIIKVAKYRDKYLVSTTKNIFLTDSLFRESEIIIDRQTGFSNTASYIFDTNSDTAIIGHTNAIYLIYSGSIHPFFVPEKKISQIVCTESSSIYLVMDDVLYELNRSCELRKALELNGSFKRMCVLKDDFLAIITTTDFILFKKGKIVNINTKWNYGDIIINDIVSDKNDGIWLSTNQGLLYYNIRNEKCNTFNRNDGLICDKIFSTVICNNSLYVNSEDGLYTMPVSIKKSNINPKFILKYIYVNDTVLKSINDLNNLSYDQNNLKFTFDINSYIGVDRKGRLVYCIEELSKNWITVEYNTINLNNLSPGRYTIKVKAVNANEVSSNEFRLPVIYISPPFWKTIWFVLLSMFLILLIIFLIIFYFKNKFKRREEENTRINRMLAEFKMNALQAQMNPHFIFNSINSIQTYILEKNSQEAYDYLSKFAKLIRVILQNANEKTLTLESELDILKTYVLLEQMRFENSFEFIFKLDENIDTYLIKIPPMLVQPFVENSIWHGIMPLKNRKGKLELNIKQIKDSIIIVVEDNGIGRNESQKMKEFTNHKSVGMNLTEQRFELLRKLSNDNEIKITIIDLFDSYNEPAGTKVEILIPKYYI